MDELIAKLRSSQPPRRGAKRAPSPAEDLAKALRRAEESSEDALSETEPPEINTSQCEARGPSFRLDFEHLAAMRGPGAGRVADALRAPGHRLDQPLYAFVKSVEAFGPGVFHWELCDETGVVCGSSSRGAAAGDIVRLEDCGIWKFERNHLNIVDENVREVVK